MKVAMVMPPVVREPPWQAVERWGTVRLVALALSAMEGAEVEVEVHARHRRERVTVHRDGVAYHFHTSAHRMGLAVRRSRPDVLHVHGLGHARLVRTLQWMAPSVPLLLQHHGEQPFRGRARLGHRIVRRRVAGYLFTGASAGQAQPWIDAGVIDPAAPLYEVLEAASLLSQTTTTPEIALAGAPVVLWVGRLIEGKDPVTAVRAFATIARSLPAAQLHLLATDRTLETDVRAAIASMGDAAARITVHPPAPHDRMRSWYAAADVFLSTSHHEAAGYALIEAMSVGCVPAVSDIPPHRVIVGSVGHLFVAGDAAGAARACIDAAGEPREPILARARIHLSWGTVAEQLVAAYRSVGR